MPDRHTDGVRSSFSGGAWCLALVVASGVVGVAGGCSLGFDTFDPRAGVKDSGADTAASGDDAAADANGSDSGAVADADLDGGDSAAIVDAGCPGRQMCLDAAMSCGQPCIATYMQCVAGCGGNGCRQQCKNAEQACFGSCAMTCDSCTTAAGCTDTAACTLASMK